MTTQRFLSNQTIVFLAISMVLLSGTVFFWHQAQVNSAPVPSDIASRDAKRISDLKQVQQDLQTYFNRCGYYPGSAPAAPPAPCPAWSATHGWLSLIVALTDPESGFGIRNVPDDPVAGMSYFYGTSAGGTTYTLGATLEDPTNPNLVQSVHGNVDGIVVS
jgi:hypothetical protein